MLYVEVPYVNQNIIYVDLNNMPVVYLPKLKYTGRKHFRSKRKDSTYLLYMRAKQKKRRKLKIKHKTSSFALLAAQK